MSFISILKKVGGVALAVEHIGAPALAAAGGPAGAALVNLLDPLFMRLLAAPLAVEAHTAALADSGQKPPGFNVARAAAVTNDFESSLSLTRDIAARNGLVLSYDMAKLRAVNDAQVASYNLMAELMASFKLTPTKPAP